MGGWYTVRSEPEERREDRVDDRLSVVRLKVVVRVGLGEDFGPGRQTFVKGFQEFLNFCRLLEPVQ